MKIIELLIKVFFLKMGVERETRRDEMRQDEERGWERKRETSFLPLFIRLLDSFLEALPYQVIISQQF